jgi:hypothetical protein
MKTLIEVNRSLWGNVKNFATVKNLTLHSAVEQLLRQGLIEKGFLVKGVEETG